jgi:MYXO-CTERM domain-containing protein
MLYTLNATNHAPKQRFHLTTAGAPATWQVDLPSDLIEIPEKSTLAFPVLVSQPFAHQHGTFLSFTVEMAGLDHPQDVGRVQLGVRYMQPPQPAGHHDTLFLHTFKNDDVDPTFATAFGTAFGFDPSNLYFNTLTPDEDENDAKVPVGGTALGFTQGVPPLQQYTWVVPLSPALAMGLDFDLARQGDLKLAMDTTLPMQGASMTGRIVHTIPDGRTCNSNRPNGNRGCVLDDYLFGAGAHLTAARIGPSPSQDVAADSRGTLFEMPVAATPAGDYLAFEPSATLAIQLNVTMVRADPFFGPKDMPRIEGGEMVLPLVEYHDPVTQVFTSLGSLMITVQGEQQRMVNPGKTALYDLDLMNHGKDAVTYDLDVSGPGSSWATVVGDRRVTVPAGTTKPLGIAVTAPVSAVDGDQSDVVLAAVDVKDPSARTLARLLTTVDTDAAHPDDSARVPGLVSQLTAKKSPGVPAEALLAALAVAAVALRRRRWDRP